jgi:hypothetical protein
MVRRPALDKASTSDNHDGPGTMHRQQREQTSLFSQVALRYGPAGILGRSILAAEQLALSKGVRLSFATAAELLAVNEANRATWLPLISVFDVRFNALNDANAFFILGRDVNGDVVACQAGRLYTWEHTSFKAECEAMTMFYRDPDSMKLPGEEWTVSALAASGMSGRVAFSGAAWYRRDYRGVGLVEWLPRLSRALAKGLWDTDVTVTVMAENNVKRGVYPRNGYRNAEWAVEAVNGRMGTLRYALLWSKSAEMIEDLEQFLRDLSPEHRTALRAVGGE